MAIQKTGGMSGRRTVPLSLKPSEAAAAWNSLRLGRRTDDRPVDTETDPGAARPFSVDALEAAPQLRRTVSIPEDLSDLEGAPVLQVRGSEAIAAAHAEGAEEVFAAVRRLLAEKGELRPEDQDLLLGQLRHELGKTASDLFQGMQALKARGSLNRVVHESPISEDMIQLIKRPGTSRSQAEYVGRHARLEMLRLLPLYQCPTLRELAGEQLATTFRVKEGQLDHEFQLMNLVKDLPMRERHQREAQALRVLLIELEKKGLRNPLTAEERRAAIEALKRLRFVGGSNALPEIRSFGAVATDPELMQAAAAASEAVQHFNGKQTFVFAAMEAKPFCQVGGLSNVMEELPKALQRLGHDVIVIIPKHRVIEDEKWHLRDIGKTGAVPGPSGTERFRVLVHEHKLPESPDPDAPKPGRLRYAMIKNDRYFSGPTRGEIYVLDKTHDYHDNAARFDFFGAAVPIATRMLLGAKKPDAFQLNDAQTAPAAIHIEADPTLGEGEVPVIGAAHNLGDGYLAQFDPNDLGETRLNGLELFGPGREAELEGKLSYAKLLLTKCHGIIAVSPTYMKETQGGKFKLSGLLQELAANDRYYGNLNGINTEVWNSEQDPFLKEIERDAGIPYTFSPSRLEGKANCKQAVQRLFGLEEQPDAALYGVVCRLTEQKGIDKVVATIEHALAQGENAEFVIYGQGEPRYVDQLKALAERYPGRVALESPARFEAAKEHLIYAGSDFLLMPSKEEPCGLPQMYVMRYGTVPIVSAVGGLKDSVSDLDGRGGGTGFRFGVGETARTVEDAFDRAQAWYETGPEGRERLLDNVARADFSWLTASAPEQLAIYREVTSQVAHRKESKA